MPDPTAGESFGNMLLDVFALPEIAFFDRSVRGMIYAAAKGEGVEGILTRFLRGSPIAAAVEFATGADWHDNISGEEMMKALGVENPGFLVSTLGAIATGPSTFVGLGALTKLGKAFRAGQIYAAGVGLAEGAEGLMQLRRGKELLQLGTREAIESVGGQVGARIPLSNLSLSEQAKIGARGIGFGIHNKVLFAPKNFNIPIYTAAETMWEGMARTKLAQAVRPMVSVLPIIGKGFSSADDSTIAATKVAENLMKTEFGERAGLAAGYAEMIDRGLGTIVKNTPEELEPFIASFKELGLDTIDAIRDPEKVAAAYSQRIAKLFGFSDEAKTEALKQSLLARITAGTIDDPDSVKFANNTLKKVFYTLGLSDNPDDAAQAFAKYWHANENIRDSYVTVRDLARVSNITDPLPTTIEELKAFSSKNGLTLKQEKAFRNYVNFRETMVGEFEAKHAAAVDAAEKLGLFKREVNSSKKIPYVKIDETHHWRTKKTGFEPLSNDPTSVVAKFTDNLTREHIDHYFDLFTEIGSAGVNGLDSNQKNKAFGAIYEYLNLADEVLGESVGIARDGSFSKVGTFGQVALAKIEETANGIAELGQSARETILHGGQGYRTMVERVAQNLREGSDAFEKMNGIGSQAIDPKKKEALVAAYEKVSKALTKKGADIAGAPVEQQIVYETLKRGAEATTYGDLVAAGVYSVDQMNSFHLAAENAAGISTLMNETYMPHVTTKEGRDFINATFKQFVKSAGSQGSSFFTKGRELTDFTLGEANQIFREMGMNATGDTPSKIMNEMGEFLNNSFRKVDPEFLEKLRKVDPNAATVFEGHAIAIQQARAVASATSIAKAHFNSALLEHYTNGGLASRVWDIGTKATHASTALQMEEALKDGRMILNVNDVLRPKFTAPRDILAESSVMRSQGVSDSARFMLQSDIEAVDEVMSKAKGVQEFIPSTGLMKEGERYVAIDRDLYGEIMRANALATSPLYMGRVQSFLHKATNYWKMWTLNNPISTFSFNARNLVGDLFLATMGGMGPKEGFDAFKDMGRVLKAAAGLGEEGLLDMKIVVGNRAMNGAELLQMMKGQGIIGHGAHVLDSYAAAEISAAKRVDKTVRDWIPGFSGERNKWLKIGNAITDQQSSWTRGAFFLDQLRKGVDPLEAARATKKYLLDYSSDLLTHTERGVLKLAVPFYTFMRRSVPAVFEGLIEQPQRFATMEKFIRNFGERTDQLHAVKEMPDTLVPDYVKEMYGVPFKVDPETGNPSFFLLKTWLPGGDIAEIAEAVRGITTGKGGKKLLDSITARINPLAKVSVEMLANYSFFTGKPIERFDGQTQEMFGSPWSAKTAYLLRQIRFLNEIDKLNPVSIAERTGELGARSEPEYAERWLSFLGGIKGAQANVATERAKTEYDIERAIRETKSQIKRVSGNVNDPGRERQLEALQKTLRSHYDSMVRTNLGFAEFRKSVGVDQ